MEEEIRWKVIDPLGNEVILKESTFREHILGDHQMADAEYRKIAETQAKAIIQNPQLIIEDKEDKNRHIFYKIISMPYDDVKKKLTTLKVVVDTDRTPHAIATWIIQSKLKYKFMEEWVIYAS